MGKEFGSFPKIIETVFSNIRITSFTITHIFAIALHPGRALAPYLAGITHSNADVLPQV